MSVLCTYTHCVHNLSLSLTSPHSTSFLRGFSYFLIVFLIVPRATHKRLSSTAVQVGHDRALMALSAGPHLISSAACFAFSLAMTLNSLHPLIPFVLSTNLLIPFVSTQGATGRVLRPSARVGFDTLPDQVVNRQALAGFRFNVLVVGETACGKSTLLDTLFNHAFPDSREGEGGATASCSRVPIRCIAG